MLAAISAVLPYSKFAILMPSIKGKLPFPYNLNRDSIVYIGDSISDLRTAKNVGCIAFGVMSGGYDLKTLIKSEKDLNYDVFPNLLEVVNHLTKNKKIRGNWVTWDSNPEQIG